jgi:cytochrome c2
MGVSSIPAGRLIRHSQSKVDWLLTLVILGISLFLIALPTANAQPLFSQASGSINLLDPSIQSELKELSTKEITIKNDPTYGGDQRYEGYEIKSFVAWLSRKTGLSLDDALVSFVATDGYVSQLPVRDIPERVGVLAFRESSGSPSKPFRDSLTARIPYNPGPFYLVWDGVFNEKQSLPTPWGVTVVKLSSNDIPAEHIPPSSSPAITKGLELWRGYCSKCHAINKVGGTMGPELNVPKNITEYWDRIHLEQLIENPASLRWGSKMPAFKWLSASDRNAIIAYLEAMKEKKVCDSEESCNR